MTPLPLFIDFEASGLALESYPIEVAWSDESGRITSFLISPETVQDWQHWSDQAEFIHGIKRKTLISDGLRPATVCAQITAALSHKRVYSDNPDFDGMWMKTLFDGARITYPDINLLSLDALLIDTLCPESRDRIGSLTKIVESKLRARKITKLRHRAAHDVEYLLKVWEFSMASNEP